MKIVYRDHIDLSVSVERAFAFATDIARWPMWFGCMVNVHLPESQELELGAVLRICMADGRRRRQETFEVTRYVRNAFLSLEGELSAAQRFDLRFEQRGSASRIAVSAGYPVFGGIFPALYDAMLRRPRVRRELHESLLHLRGLLDDGAASRYHADELSMDEAQRIKEHTHHLHSVDRSPQVA
ncbi:MAG TPA: hypothetical protein VID19_10100 [Candidatus Eremiobacteraceae bacterium]|jgi:hypothetical protein